MGRIPTDMYMEGHILSNREVEYAPQNPNVVILAEYEQRKLMQIILRELKCLKAETQSQPRAKLIQFPNQDILSNTVDKR